MTRRLLKTACVCALAGLSLPLLAQAHPGHASDASFAAGALHPFSGADHVLLLAVAGWLAARLSGRARAVLGAAFAGLLVASATADSSAWSYVAGFLCASAGVITGVAAVIIIAPRSGTCPATAAATRSRT